MTAQDTRFTARVWTMQIIAFAMIFAIFIMGGVLIFMASNEPGAREGEPPLITYVALGVTGLACVMSILVPNLMAAKLVQKSVLQSRAGGEGTDMALAGAYQTTLIVGLALCEGPAMFCLIAYFVERSQLAFVGAGVAVLLMLIRFPTEDRVRDWARSYSGHG